MIQQDRLKTIVNLALPIIGAMISSNLLGLVDTYMVSHLGETALAATAMGGFAGQLIMALVAGFSSGVQAMTARRKGEDKKEVLCHPLNSGLFMALIVGLPVTLVTYSLVPSFFPTLIDDPEVVALGIPYMEIIVLSTIPVGMSVSFTGFWNGVGRPRVYMNTLIATHIVNVFLNWVLIYGNLGAPALGVTGAALASLTAVLFGLSIYFVLGFRKTRENGFLATWPDKTNLRNLLKLALPSCFQRGMFWLGYLLFFWMVARVGVEALAVANVLTQLTMFTILPGMGMGMAAATLVGQALGREDSDDAYKWTWDVIKVGGFAGFGLGLPLVLFPGAVLSFFNLGDPAILAIGIVPTQIVGITTGIFSFNYIFMNSLLGAGAARRVMFTSMACQWGFFIPAVYVAAIVLNQSLTVIWIVQACYGIMAGLAYGIQWKMRVWTDIKV